MENSFLECISGRLPGPVRPHSPRCPGVTGWVGETLPREGDTSGRSGVGPWGGGGNTRFVRDSVFLGPESSPPALGSSLSVPADPTPLSSRPPPTSTDLQGSSLHPVGYRRQTGVETPWTPKPVVGEASLPPGGSPPRWRQDDKGFGVVSVCRDLGSDTVVVGTSVVARRRTEGGRLSG